MNVRSYLPENVCKAQPLHISNTVHKDKMSLCTSLRTHDTCLFPKHFYCLFLPHIDSCSRSHTLSLYHSWNRLWSAPPAPPCIQLHCDKDSEPPLPIPYMLPLPRGQIIWTKGHANVWRGVHTIECVYVCESPDTVNISQPFICLSPSRCRFSQSTHSNKNTQIIYESVQCGCECVYSALSCLTYTS